MEQTSIINRLGDSLEGSVLQYNENANIDKSERIVSVGTGAFIGLKGVTNIFSNPMIALTELGIGGLLLYRGVTGYCPLTAMANADRVPVSGREAASTTAVTDAARVDPEIAY